LSFLRSFFLFFSQEELIYTKLVLKLGIWNLHI